MEEGFYTPEMREAIAKHERWRRIVGRIAATLILVSLFILCAVIVMTP